MLVWCQKMSIRRKSVIRIMSGDAVTGVRTVIGQGPGGQDEPLGDIARTEEPWIEDPRGLALLVTL